MKNTKVFRHNTLEISKLEQHNPENGPRFYTLPGDDQKFISVTSVLGAVSDKSFLEEWKKRVGEKKAAEISHESATRGTLMHKAAEQYLSNCKTIHFTRSKYGIQAKGLFRQIKQELDKIDNIYGLETQVYSKKLGIAGTADCIAEYDGTLSLIDFKNSRKPKRREWIENYFVQCTFYSLMFEELTQLTCEQLVVIISVYGELKPQVFIEKRSDHLDEAKRIYKEWRKQNEQ